MFVEISPYSPDGRQIAQVVQKLEKGGVIIYPTDGVYGLGCSIDQPKSVERICKIRGLDIAKTQLTVICKDIAQMQQYIKEIDSSTFKVLKRNTPGPFTFILTAHPKVSKLFKNRRKTLGIRIIDNPIVTAILDQLGLPLLSLSLKADEELEYLTDPYEMHEMFKHSVDFVIDGGFGSDIPSTVVDLTGDEPNILRQSEGILK